MIIYSIRNKINNKRYIGQTIKSLQQRIDGHLKEVACGRDRHLYNAIRKYGWNNFECIILCECTSKLELDEKEKYYI